MALAGAYKLFDQENDIVSNIKATVSSGIWSGGTGTLTTFFTQSAQSQSSGIYYYDVYKTNHTDAEREIQFSVAYGHIQGSGSKGTVGGATGNRATAAIHSQLVNLVLPPNKQQFTYGDGSVSKHFFVISLKRSRMREKMDPGNWELELSGSKAKIGHDIRLIDDSKSTTNPEAGIGGRVFNVVSGSIRSGVSSIPTAASVTGSAYGLFYPDLGLIVLNADMIKNKSSFGDGMEGVLQTSDANVGNARKFFNQVKGGAYFQARREEKLSSTHYFVRAGNKEFNFSNNPTFFTASTGDFTQPTFFKDPKVYVTTVGLYNDSNELLAVAKLSQPVLKSYSREALIKVKLDF